MNAGLLYGDERRLDAEDFTDALGRQHFGGGACRHDAPVIQQYYLVRKARGEIQVVNHSHRDNIRSVRKDSHLFHELDLMANVQESERLVKEQIAAGQGLRGRSGSSGWAGAIAPQLRKDAREVDALALASAQSLVIAVAELRHVEELNQFIGDTFVHWTGASAEVRVASHHDDLA